MLPPTNLEIERVQTGVRIEKRILKVLKAFAEYHDMTLGDVLEGIVLHAFDGKTPFSPASLARIRELKKFYDLDLDSSASHRLNGLYQTRNAVLFGFNGGLKSQRGDDLGGLRADGSELDPRETLE